MNQLATRNRTNNYFWPQVESLFDQFFPETVGKPKTYGPPLDAWETNKEYVIELEVAGISKDKLDITVEGDLLTVTGRVDYKKEEKPSGYLIQERFHKGFSRSVRLANGADMANVKATLENGILRIEIPKTEEKKIKKIDISPALPGI